MCVLMCVVACVCVYMHVGVCLVGWLIVSICVPLVYVFICGCCWLGGVVCVCLCVCLVK